MERKKKRAKRIRILMIVLSVCGMLAGLGVLMYPTAMDIINSRKNEQAISSMSSVYDRYGENAAEIEAELSQAHSYNDVLSGSSEGIIRTDDYEEQLDFDGNGIMGYIEIPSIGVKMLIYHGTGDDVLAVGAGHLEGTSLPVGGESTHSVITAHSGMKTMTAFDNLRKLKEGDTFSVTVLGRKCTYVVDSIETVLPYETDSLGIVKGEDRITLVTCTPYGINDHRLLVHGIRNEDAVSEEEAEGDVISELLNEPETEEAESPGLSWQEMLESFFSRLSEARKTPMIVAICVSAGAVITAALVTGKRKRKNNDD